MVDGIKIIIFDLDGTVVDAYQPIIRSFNFTMRKLKLPVQDEWTIRRAVGWGNGALLKPFVGEDCLEEARAIYRKHHRKELLKGTRSLPGAKRLLRLLKKRGYKLAVASNRPTESSDIILEHLNVRDYFDYILCGDKIKRPKPAPDILRKILKKFSLRPSQALYVGDMTVDVLAGRRARVKTVAVVTGSSTREEIKKLKPFKVISHISELFEVIV